MCTTTWQIQKRIFSQVWSNRCICSQIFKHLLQGTSALTNARNTYTHTAIRTVAIKNLSDLAFTALPVIRFHVMLEVSSKDYVHNGPPGVYQFG